MSQFLMPSLGADMAAGTLVEQSIAPGTAFRRGDMIGAVETQKGVIEIEVFEDGILDRWLAELGTEVPVGMPLAQIRQQGEPEPAYPEIPPETDPSPAPVPPELPSEPLPEPHPEPISVPEPPPETAPPLRETVVRDIAGRQRITPAARRLAAENGVDLAALSRTADSVISRRTVEALSNTHHPTVGPESTRTGDAALDMRTAIAAAMTRSKREIPHYYLAHDIDLSAADAFLTDRNALRPTQDRVLIGALFVRAIAVALTKYPEFNGRFGPDGFVHSDAVHLGVAIHIRSGGLVAPAILDADSQDVTATMTTLGDLVARVRAGRFRARELSDATITLTSLGDRGVDQVIGVIYPPQVAIIGIGTPRLQPMVHEGGVVPRLVAKITVAADHRVSDGHRGALFLRAIDARLQEPETL